MKKKPTVKQTISSKFQALDWNSRLYDNEYKQRRMTYGKYINVMIKDIPTPYIKWGILNLGDLKTANYFARELQSREPKYK